MAELAAKYRDRARERRDGVEGMPGSRDEGGEDPSSASTSGYRAVAPDVKSSYDAAERRRQMIQESKFLGGDMEHTHLVKGLDFALLQKVRSEIAQRELEGQDDEDEEADGEGGDDAEEQEERATAAEAKPKNRAERRAAVSAHGSAVGSNSLFHTFLPLISRP